MYLRDVIYFGALLASVIFSFIRYPALQRAEKVIAALLLATLLHEAFSFGYYIQNKSNLLLLRVYSLVEFVLLMRYYHLLLRKSRFRSATPILLAAGGLWFIVPFLLPQYVSHPFSFVLFEALAIIIAGLLYCIKLLLDEQADMLRCVSFWITVALLIYWATTYTQYGLQIAPGRASPAFLSVVKKSFFIINILFYAALTLILGCYRRFAQAYD